jgi:hypothetical protein
MCKVIEDNIPYYEAEDELDTIVDVFGKPIVKEVIMKEDPSHEVVVDAFTTTHHTHDMATTTTTTMVPWCKMNTSHYPKLFLDTKEMKSLADKKVKELREQEEQEQEDEQENDSQSLTRKGRRANRGGVNTLQQLLSPSDINVLLPPVVASAVSSSSSSSSLLAATTIGMGSTNSGSNHSNKRAKVGRPKKDSVA